MVWTVINPFISGGLSQGGFMGGTPSGAFARSGNTTLLYDGISWAAGPGNAQPSGIGSGGDGLETAALKAGGSGGSDSRETESYDGISWTAEADLPWSTIGPRFVGDSGNGHLIGRDASGARASVVWNGSGWTGDAISVFSVSAYGAYGGTPTSALNMCVGAQTGVSTQYDQCQEYNGTSFSVASDALVARGRRPGGSGGSSADFVILFNGDSTLATDIYQNGTWSVGPSTNNAHRTAVSLDNSFSSSMVGGDHNTSIDEIAEEFDGPPECWNFTAHYAGSKRLFKASGCGPFPKYLNVPGNIDKSTGRMIDDGVEIDPDEYEIV